MTRKDTLIQVQGMTCQGCARTVERSARVVLAGGRVDARAPPATRAADVVAAIQTAGHAAKESG